MLDAWVTPERWRIAVPPIGLVRRGAADEPADLPVGFLRWWFCTPMGGTLSAATFDGPARIWLLRDGPAIVELRADTCDRGPHLLATRRAFGRTESVEECRADSQASAGDRARYEDAANGLAVDLVLESVSDEPPPQEAFGDPDSVEAP